jgi:hypothetical protein
MQSVTLLAVGEACKRHTKSELESANREAAVSKYTWSRALFSPSMGIINISSPPPPAPPPHQHQHYPTSTSTTTPAPAPSTSLPTTFRQLPTASASFATAAAEREDDFVGVISDAVRESDRRDAFVCAAVEDAVGAADAKEAADILSLFSRAMVSAPSS